MFVNKYSLLRRIISLTVASLMVLSLTPGIVAIAQDFLINSPVSNSADGLIAYVNNNVTIAGTAPSDPGEGVWEIKIYWDDYDPGATMEETISYNASWSASHTYLPYTLDGEEKPPDGLKNISAKIFKDGEEYTEIDPAFSIPLIVVDTEPPSIKNENVVFALPSESTSSDTLNINQTTGEVTVSGKVNINVEVTDWTKVSDRPGEVDKVEFYIDGMWKETDKTVGSDGKYSYPWDGTSLPVGDHIVKVIATDKAGNRSVEYTKTVTVKKHFEESIGATGGSPAIPADYKVSLEVPSGALSSDTLLTLDVVPVPSSLVPAPPEGYTVLPRAYIFGPSPLTFSNNKEVTLTFHYTEDELQGKDESKLGVYYYDTSKGSWVYQTGTLDKDAETITIKVNHFSDFGLFIDTVPPTVTSTSPANNATGVAVTSKVTATFSEDMDSSSVTTAGNFTMGTNSTSVGGTVTYDSASRTATFTPAANLSYNTEYKAKISTNVKDLFGNNMTAEKVWTFKTSAQPPSVPTGLTATPGDRVINLTWNLVPEATGYKIYWGTSSGIYDKPTVNVVGGNVISHQLTGLTNGITYYIAISAYNASAESSKSSEKTAKPTGSYGLTISKTVDKANASPNDTLTYTITYKNTGNSELTNVQLTDQIPDGTSYVANSATAGTYDATATSISLTLTSLAAGSEGTLSFKVTVAPTAAGTIVNTASIKSTEITTAKTDSASTTIGVATTVAATGGDATAAGTTGPATTAAATTAAAAGAAKKLPRTGMELMQYLIIAMLLIASGLSLQFVGRREEM